MITLEIIIQILTFLMVCYFVFFNTYLKEKGKNMATQQDIAKITEKIETVKTEIQHSSFQKSEWLDKNKVSILDYYEVYIDLVEHTIKDISVIESNFANPGKIRDKIDLLSKQKSQFEKSFWKLCLFEYKDSDFINSVQEIHLAVTKLTFLTLQFLIDNEKIATHIELSLKNDSPVDRFIKDRDKTISYFVKERDEQEKIVNKKTVLLMHIIRKKIKEKYE